MVLSYRSLTDWTLLYQAGKSFKLFTNKVVDLFNLFTHLGWISIVYSACISKVSTVQFISALLQKLTFGQGQSQMCFGSPQVCLCRLLSAVVRLALYPGIGGCTCQNVFSYGLKWSSLFDPFLSVRLMACCRRALLSPLLWRESSYCLLSAAAAHKDTFLASSY